MRRGARPLAAVARSLRPLLALEVKPAQIPPPQITVRKLELPPERKAGRIVGEGSAAVPELVKLLQTEAKVL